MPYKLIDGFIGHEQYLEIEPWSQCSIAHERNRLGHRSDEPEQVAYNASGYILVTGCSITEGVALRPEQTWSYILAKKLTLPVYNLALQGTGLDVQLHNLQQWLWKYPRPKFLARTDTGASARIVANRNDRYFALGSWLKSSPRDLEMLDIMNQQQIFDTQYDLWKTLYSSDDQTISVVIRPKWDDRAVDGFHPGPVSHQNMAKDAYNQIMKQISSRR
jgi:hypothetical protein